MSSKKSGRVWLTLKEKQRLVGNINALRTKGKGMTAQAACKSIDVNPSKYYAFTKQLNKLNAPVAKRKYNKHVTSLVPVTNNVPDTDFFQINADSPSRPIAVVIGNKEDLLQIFGAMNKMVGG